MLIIALFYSILHYKADFFFLCWHSEQCHSTWASHQCWLKKQHRENHCSVISDQSPLAISVIITSTQPRAESWTAPPHIHTQNRWITPGRGDAVDGLSVSVNRGPFVSLYDWLTDWLTDSLAEWAVVVERDHSRLKLVWFLFWFPFFLFIVYSRLQKPGNREAG